MPNRLLVVPSIGEVVMTKRRGNRNIRLTITAAGQVRVALPHWAPYIAGLQFVKKNQVWIRQQLQQNAPNLLQNGSLVGRWHRVVFIPLAESASETQVRLSRNAINVKTNILPTDVGLQRRLLAAAERALKQESEQLFPARLDYISRQHNLTYNNLKIRKLTSRWGSCSSKKEISLSYFLVQLPDELVDYVLLHELAHTVYHDHGQAFWAFMAERVPNLRQIRRQIKTHRPRVEPR